MDINDKVMYRIENTIVERLKEQNLNVTDLLQRQARRNKKPDNEVVEVLLQMTDSLNEKIKTLHELGATNEEIIKLLEDAGMVVGRVEND